MLTCAKCHQFSAFINENRLCNRCSKKHRQKMYDLMIVCFESKDAVPYLRNRTILSKSNWIELRAKIDKYYNSVSNDDIDAYNAEIRKENKIAKRRLINEPGFIYLLSSSVGLYKIGRTIDMERRFSDHVRTWPVELKIVHQVPVNQVVSCETFLLRRFRDKQKQGEWFDLDESDIEWLKSLDTDALESIVADALGI